MKKLYFRASLDITAYQRHEVKRSENLVITKYSDDWAPIVQAWLRECVDANDRRIANGKSCCELEITIKAHYDDRTVKANSLMWVIYDLQAQILNREGQYIRNPIKPMELYKQDMEGYAPTHEKVCDSIDAAAIIAFAESGECEYRGHLIGRASVGGYDLTNEKVKLTFRETSSFWDTATFATFIEYKLAELETMGRDRWNDGTVKGLIDDFMKNIKEKEKPLKTVNN